MPAGLDHASKDNQNTLQRRDMAINESSLQMTPPKGEVLRSSPDADNLGTVERRSPVNKKSTEYMIKSGIAGGFAGCAAKTVVGPLDRVKILFQTSNPHFQKYTGSWSGLIVAMKDIYRQTGTRGLFRGHSATLLRIFPYAGIKFLAYEQIRAIVIRDNSQETPGRRFLSGALAGLASVFFTYPLEVIRVRLAFETKDHGRATLTSICRRIYAEHPPIPRPSNPMSAEVTASAATAIPRAAVSAANAAASVTNEIVPRAGLANFYRGFTPTLWGMLPYAGASFLTHDVAQDFLRRPFFAKYTTIPGTAKSSKPAQLTIWAQLTAGGLAGLVSQTVSYPLEVVRRRMQVGGAVGDGHRLGMLEVTRNILAQRGWRGFFVGLSIGYVKVVPMTATSFFVYERGKYYLGI